MYTKHFDDWNIVKKQLDHTTECIFVRQREIRWCSLGVNIGSEIDGKGPNFTRPVLILRVIGNRLALVAPLSTQLKDVPGYLRITVNDTIVSACANQIRTISQQRLFDRYGKLSEKKFTLIREQIFEFLK